MSAAYISKNPPEPLITTKELCALLKRDRKTVHRWETEGRLSPYVDDPGGKLYLYSEVLDQLKRYETRRRNRAA